MLKQVLFVGLLIVCAYAADEAPEVEVEEPARLFATVTTTFSTKVLSTGVLTTTTSCASVASNATACRRRRGLEERPIVLSLEDEIEPSLPVAVEASAAPVESREARMGSITPDLISSTNEDGLVELYVTGLRSCGEQRNFGIAALSRFQVTIQVTATTTLTYSSTTTATNTYQIAGCSPAGIVTCAASG